MFFKFGTWISTFVVIAISTGIHGEGLDEECLINYNGINSKHLMFEYKPGVNDTQLIVLGGQECQLRQVFFYHSGKMK